MVRFVCALALLSAAPNLSADESRPIESQTREFRISVDGRPRGTCRMDIQHRDDGSDVMRVESSLHFNYIVYNYRYSSKGIELWNGERLINLQNRSDFNGDVYHLKATADANALAIQINDESATAKPPVWPTSYWRLPKFVTQSRTVTLLDSDRGRILDAKLDRVGQESLAVAGKTILCTHYRLSGDVEVDLWYDPLTLLVRQEAVESGHRTLLELTHRTP